MLSKKTTMDLIRDKLAHSDWLKLLFKDAQDGLPDTVAGFYRSLRQPKARCECLRALFQSEAFGKEEIQVLLEQLKLLQPNAFQVARMTGSESIGLRGRSVR